MKTIKTLEDLYNDFVIKKADLNAEYYTQEDFVRDANYSLKKLYLSASQTGTGLKQNTEIIDLQDDVVTYSLSNPYAEIKKVEISYNDGDDWYCLDKTEPCNHIFCSTIYGESFIIDDETIYITEAKTGDKIKITYSKPINSDYELTAITDIPKISEDFVDLLWLEPVIEQLYKYRPEKVDYYLQEYKDLKQRWDRVYQKQIPRGKMRIKNNFRR